MAERGEVRAVAWMPQGSELAADAAVGALTMTVANPVDFDEDGGTLELNGVQLDYETIDPDTGILTLSAALATAASAGDRVDVVAGGLVAVDYVAFVSPRREGDEVEGADPLRAAGHVARGRLRRPGGRRPVQRPRGDPRRPRPDPGPRRVLHRAHDRARQRVPGPGDRDRSRRPDRPAHLPADPRHHRPPVLERAAAARVGLRPDRLPVPDDETITAGDRLRRRSTSTATARLARSSRKV